MPRPTSLVADFYSGITPEVVVKLPEVVRLRSTLYPHPPQLQVRASENHMKGS